MTLCSRGEEIGEGDVDPLVLTLKLALFCAAFIMFVLRLPFLGAVFGTLLPGSEMSRGVEGTELAGVLRGVFVVGVVDAALNAARAAAESPPCATPAAERKWSDTSAVLI